MRILPFSDASLSEAVTVLQGGGIVAHATETCYGFACDMRNRDAVERLFSLKKRPIVSPVSGLFASIEDAKECVLWSAEADALAAEHLPGPLTLILPLRDSSLFPTPGGATTLGVRVSSHPHAMLLASRFAHPLTTTSANLHGRENPYSAEDIQNQFDKEDLQPNLILDSGVLPAVPPSTVLDLTKKEGERELRRGHVRF